MTIYRITILLVLINLGSSCLMAQQAEIDSLWSVYDTASEDTTRSHALTDIAYKLLYSNKDSSAKIAQQAYDMAKAANWPKGQMRAMTQIINCLSMSREFEAAEDSIEVLLSIAGQSKDRKGLANALFTKASLLRSQGKRRAAISTYWKSHDLAEELEEFELQAKALGNMGMIYYSLFPDYNGLR